MSKIFSGGVSLFPKCLIWWNVKSPKYNFLDNKFITKGYNQPTFSFTKISQCWLINKRSLDVAKIKYVNKWHLSVSEFYGKLR